MQLRQLEYVTAIVKHRTMRRAAQELFVSESTISQQVQALEIEIGFSLFEQQGRNLVLSEQGKEILPDLENVLRMKQRLEEKAARIKHPEIKSIRLGLTYDAVMMYLPQIVVQFREAYPRVALEICQNGGYALAEQINNQQIDIAVFVSSSLAPIPVNSAIAQIIRTSDIVAIASNQHQLARKEHISKEQLMQAGIIIGSRAFLVPNLLHAVLKDEINIVCLMNSPEATLELAQAGVGVAFVPRYVMHGEQLAIRTRGLTTLDLDPGLYFPTHHVCASSIHQSEQIRVLTRIIKDCFAQ